MSDKRFIVIPGCSDLNRGDQALAWETRSVAEDAGFVGDYALLAERDEPSAQSKAAGFQVLEPVLQHPSRHFQTRENIIYDRLTRLRWASVAVSDLILSLAILKLPWARRLVARFRPRSPMRRTLEWFGSADAVFMKGGGLLQSHGGILSTYATYYRLYHIFLAQSFGKPVYVMPNSFGPFDGPLVRAMIRRALSKCTVVTTRESRSTAELEREVGIHGEQFPDLAFFLDASSRSRDEIRAELGLSPDDRVVAITMRPYRFPDAEDPAASYARFQDEMRDIIRGLFARGFVPLIVEHTFAVTSHESDGDCIRGVVSGLPPDMYRLFSSPDRSCRELKSVYAACDYVIGTRFHSMIFALSSRIPGIAISYDGYKSVGIMRDMGLEAFVVDISGVSADLVMNMFLRCCDERNSILERIDHYLASAVSERQRLVEVLR